jgi:hypothetical protein
MLLWWMLTLNFQTKWLIFCLCFPIIATFQYGYQPIWQYCHYIRSLFRKFGDWACERHVRERETAHTSFPHLIVFNSPALEAQPLWWEAVVSASVIVCNLFSTTVEMEINRQLEQRIIIKFIVKVGKSGPEIC